MKPLSIIVKLLSLLMDKKRSHYKNNALKAAIDIYAPNFNLYLKFKIWI